MRTPETRGPTVDELKNDPALRELMLAVRDEVIRLRHDDHLVFTLTHKQVEDEPEGPLAVITSIAAGVVVPATPRAARSDAADAAHLLGTYLKQHHPEARQRRSLRGPFLVAGRMWAFQADITEEA